MVKILPVINLAALFCSFCKRSFSVELQHPPLYEARWTAKQAGSDNGPDYFYSLLPVNWELILHGSELAQ